ncbi:MAG: hypothetical protein J5685_03505 [Clostridiales bacterium]|nr:hypothetical protein [Clostridiales bacterium]
MEYVFALGKIPSDKYGLIGGKASSLDLMIKKLKVNVPHGYVVTSDAFVNGKITPEAQKEIEDLERALPSGYAYAVRSSAINEDGNEASFAGQYETITDVKRDDIIEALKKVVSSSGSERVGSYARNNGREEEGIAVVIQRFVKAEFAGVVFTSDVITGKDDELIGNYVKGEGEKLVSGSENAEEFRIGRIRYYYKGSSEMASYSRKLAGYCEKIISLYGVPMDIEWAASGGKVYILQARPITTLRRTDMRTYKVNGTMNGYKLLTRTNVGEIFMQPVSPITFSVLEKINGFLELPDWLDNICGQPYMNISVMCSAMVSFGKTEEQAFEIFKDLVGNVPEGVKVPVSFFDKKAFLKRIKTILFSKNRSKLSKKEKMQVVRDLPDICRSVIKELRAVKSESELLSYWDNDMLPGLNDAFASIFTACGTSMIPLFSTRKKITEIAGSDTANRLCGGFIGTLESMKPMLLIEDVIRGDMTRDQYVEICGHRSVNEMELMEPRPYEREGYPDDLLEERKRSGTDLHEMLNKQKEEFDEALTEFKSKYPSRSKWIDKELMKYSKANAFREDIRSKGVWIFCVFREFLLSFGRITGISDDVFMLTMDEVFDCLRGDRSCFAYIPERKKTFEEYRTYPMFPSLILGRFEPSRWMEDDDRRRDFYCEEMLPQNGKISSDVKGFPGARGTVSGVVRVVTDVRDIDQIKEGEILVTVATNIGWTLVFPKVSAIVTDIGAPLSHAAIVAREFGIPAVVGCGNATTVLKTGDKVEVDGQRGRVTLI